MLIQFQFFGKREFPNDYLKSRNKILTFNQLDYKVLDNAV